MTHLNTSIKTLVLVLSSLGMVFAQEEPTGMPGDHFSLYGALELFKKAESLEEYEELLNKADNQVNNLDLNGDNEVDYIRVEDIKDGDAHVIRLQIPISEKEAQDIAVIAIERTPDKYATLQIIGNEDIYGEEIIVEPYEETSSGSGKGGPDASYDITRVVVNAWSWPSVRWIYHPSYRVYASPWSWGYYPRWWRPWRPLSWAVYSPRTVTWRVGFRMTPTIRVTAARRIYTPRRTTSVTVVNRYRVNKTTYISKKKTTTVKNGNRTVVKNSNQKAVVNKSQTKAVATDGNRKAVVDRTTKRVVATDGTKKAAIDRTTSKAVVTNGNKKGATKKKTTKVKASNGKKKLMGKKTTKKKVKKN